MCAMQSDQTPLQLEDWRRWLAGHVNSLNQYHPIYRLLLATGAKLLVSPARLASDRRSSWKRAV